MHFQKFNSTYIITLDKNEEIIETLTRICKDQKIHTAIFSAIGAVSAITLGFYELASKSYHWQDFSGNLEVASLTGNVMLLKDEPFLHIHTVVTNETLQAFGGHLKTGVVGVTLEVVLEALDGKMERQFNDEIGLNLIDIK